MEAVRLVLDELLLEELEASQAVRQEGRSAALRRALAAYLRRRRPDSIAGGYVEAYPDEDGLGAEWARREEQEFWPVERTGARSGSAASPAGPAQTGACPESSPRHPVPQTVMVAPTTAAIHGAPSDAAVGIDDRAGPGVRGEP